MECKDEPVNQEGNLECVGTGAEAIRHPTNNLCCILLLHHTIVSTNSTSHLHTKDKPSHRRIYYTHNLNEIDLQNLHTFPKNINLLYSLQLSLLHFITCNF
jgi:hypothetical protein